MDISSWEFQGAYYKGYVQLAQSILINQPTEF